MTGIANPLSGILVYLFPAAMDVVLSSVFFMSTVWAAEKGVSPAGVANLLSTWAVIYMFSSLLCGRVIKPRNVGWLLIGSCVGAAVLSVGFASCRSLLGLYVLMGLEGVALAVFFVGFQVFMKLVGQNMQRPVGWSVGLYTCSWSIGFATGPFVAGFLWGRFSWEVCQGLTGGLSLAVALGLYLLKHQAERRAPHQAAEEEGGRDATGVSRYADMPDLAWMGWLFSGLGCAVVSLIRGVFPTTGAECSLSRLDQGLILCVLSAVQAGVGLLLSMGRLWMFRPLPVLLFSLAGVVGLALLALSDTTGGFLVAVACFGLYSGSFYFYLVFHALIHPEHSSRYVSINEAVVGLAGIAGPFLGGLTANRLRSPAAYALAAATLLLAALIQSWLCARIVRAGRSRPTGATCG